MRLIVLAVTATLMLAATLQAQTPVPVVTRSTFELEHRIQMGERQAIDSILTVWQTSRDAAERIRTLEIFMRNARPDSLLIPRVLGLALAARDTASAFELLLRWAGGDPLGVPEVAFLLPYLIEPARAAAFVHSRSLYGSPDWLYEQFLDRATWNPFNPERWRCKPAACALLHTQVNTPGDDRLRQLAWALRTLQDPVRGYDTLAAQVHADSTRKLLYRIHRFAQGEVVGSRSRSAPAPDEDWRAWLQWMGGRTTLVPLPYALDFVRKRTGRDFAGELIAAYRAATEDSARLVLGIMAMRFGYQPTTDEVEQHLDSEAQALRELAIHQLPPALSRAVLADSALQEQIVGPLLAWRFEGANWPFGVEAPRFPGPTPALRGTSYLQTDSLPPAVLRYWANRGQVISRSDWDARSPREQRELYTVSPVRAAGRFVTVNFFMGGYLARGPEARPHHYGSAVYLTLRRTARGWVVVSSSGVVS